MADKSIADLIVEVRFDNEVGLYKNIYLHIGGRIVPSQKWYLSPAEAFNDIDYNLEYLFTAKMTNGIYKYEGQ
jgi:hypothetical protein